jgi:hypothetical protein
MWGRFVTDTSDDLMRRLTAVSLFVLGLLLGLYGVLALTYGEGEGGDTSVSVAGHRLDADLVGGVSLVAGLAVITEAVALARRGRIRP